MKIAVVGDELIVRAFELAGAEEFIANDDQSVVNIVRDLITSGQYGIIILPEKFLMPTRKIREELLRRRQVAPIFIFIPDYTGFKDERAKELKKIVSLAIGAEYNI